MGLGHAGIKGHKNANWGYFMGKSQAKFLAPTQLYYWDWFADGDLEIYSPTKKVMS
jgi:hypothetical protein